MARKVLVIAEIGENHAGDWDLARRMVVEAIAAGADIVKFQSYVGSEVADSDPEKEWFTRVQLPDALHVELKALAEQHGGEFLSSAFSLGRAAFLVETLGLSKIKVASSEMLNFPLLDYLNRRAGTVFLSTGMATLPEIGEAVAHLSQVKDLYLLQCTTQYPCPPEAANLAVIPALRAAFSRCRPGYSDHGRGILAPVAAAALGAEVIEKHFTLDRSLPGTDHALSALPSEFRTMVEQIREVEVLLGNATKAPTPEEGRIREFVRGRFRNA